MRVTIPWPRTRPLLVSRPDPRALAAPPRVVDLAGNQLPVPPPQTVVQAARDATADLNVYPEAASHTLVERLARHLRVDRDRVVVGAGAAALLRELMFAVCEPTVGDDENEIVFAEPGFDGYRTFAEDAWARPVPVPLTAGRQDLDGMLAAVDRDRTRMIIVCNPHNPSGSLMLGDEREDFLDRVPGHVLVVFDEAYREFVTETDVPDGLRFDPDHPEREALRTNVVVLRTFSKAYGLGGLRVGYLVADPYVADAVRKSTGPFTTNRGAQAAAVAALDAADAGEYEPLWAAVLRERDHVHTELTGLGYAVRPAQANFLWLELGRWGVEFSQHCATHGVLVRAYPQHGVRVSIGQARDNGKFLAAARTFPLRRQPS